MSREKSILCKFKAIKWAECNTETSVRWEEQGEPRRCKATLYFIHKDTKMQMLHNNNLEIKWVTVMKTNYLRGGVNRHTLRTRAKGVSAIVLYALGRTLFSGVYWRLWGNCTEKGRKGEKECCHWWVGGEALLVALYAFVKGLNLMWPARGSSEAIRSEAYMFYLSVRCITKVFVYAEMKGMTWMWESVSVCISQKILNHLINTFKYAVSDHRKSLVLRESVINLM